jgi:hypothetical protein
MERAAMFDSLPEWMKYVGTAVSGSLFTLGLALLNAKVGLKRISVDERTALTAHLLQRVQMLEDGQLAERKFCEERITQICAEHNSRLDARDRIITELRDRISTLEQLTCEHQPRS